MRYLPLFALVAALTSPLAANARPASAGIALVPPASDNCKLSEQANLSVNFDGMSETATDVPVKLQKEIDAIAAYAKDLGINELKAQSQSYSIYTQMMGGKISGYNYNTSVSYEMDNAEQAVKLMERLTDKSMQTSLNVNSNYEGDCE